MNPSLEKFKGIDQGYLCLANMLPEGFTQTFFKTTDLRRADAYIQDHRAYDSYNAQAVFRTAYRSRNNVRVLTEHCLDIDNHLSPFTQAQAEQFESEVLRPVYDIAIPEPSQVIYTGRGLQLHFSLRGADDTRKWEYTQKALIERAKQICYKQDALLNVLGLSVDEACSDTARVWRTANTTNTKANKETRIIYEGQASYTQDEIIGSYNLTWTTEKGRGKGKKHSLRELQGLSKEQVLKATQKELREFKGYAWYYSRETLNQARKEDLIKLIEIRNSQGIREGYRNNLLSIAVQLEREGTNDAQMIYNHLGEYNSYFLEPLEDSCILAWTRTAMKHQCYFTNKHIIDKLSITPEDQEQLSTIIGKKEKNRRYYFKNQDSIKAKLNSRYRPTKTANQMQRNIKKAKAKTLYKQGHSVREITLELKLNERTIRRYL